MDKARSSSLSACH